MGEAPADRWLIHAIVASNFGPAFMFSGVAVALPAMGRELSLSAVELGLVETTFLAGSTAFLLPAGRLADATGRRTLLRWSFVAFGVLSLAIGLSSHGATILLLRLLQGIAAALIGACGPAILIELVPVERRGRAFGAVMSWAYAGLACGPLAAGWLVAEVSWRAVFLVGSAPILLGAATIWWRLAPRWLPPGRWVHPPSLVLLLTGITALLFGTSVPAHAAVVAVAIAGGAVALAAFLLLQRRLHDPLLDVRELGSNGVLSSALLVQLLLYLNAYCSYFVLSLFLQVTKGMSSTRSGLVLAVGSAVMAFVAPFAGRLADRVRAQRVAAAGIAAVVVSSALGLLLGPHAPWWHVVVVLATQGVGFGLFSSPNMTIILGSLPRERSGVASAIAAQARTLGMFAGMAAAGAFMAAWIGERAVTEDPARVADVVRGAYSVLLVTSALALLASRWRPRADPG